MVACSCASVAPAMLPVPRGVEQYAAKIDWHLAGDEAVQMLSAYVKVDTFSPPGNELRGAEFLAAALQKDGISSQVFESSPGRGNLIARLPATGVAQEKPLCLLSHLDVVTAEAERWPEGKGPLSGAIVDGEIWGRGTLDMKGMGTLETLTLVWLKRQQVPLRREVILLAVADEEVGNEGMRYLVDKKWGELECGHLINEGGIGLKNLMFPGQTVFGISVAEKGVLWLKLKAVGEAGHGSTPIPGRAPMELLHAASRLMQREPKPRIHGSLYELLRAVGVQRGGFNGFVMQRPTLVDALVMKRLLSKPTTRAVVTDTCQVTGYRGVGSSPNVIPSQAEAVIDCRLLPGTTPDALLAELTARIADMPGVSLEVIAGREANESPWQDPLFQALARHVVDGRADAVAGPALSPGYTDSILARPKGTRAYGFIPFEVTQEELGGMHGRDEHVSIANVKRGLEVLYRSVLDVAAVPPN